METGGLEVTAIHLNKWVRKDLNILQDISLHFRPREFIIIVGQSGGGKSTLVDAIAGYSPATHGKVLVNDVDLYQNFGTLRTKIGFVPQRDIIHMELTVYQALDYAARLRMPRDTSAKKRQERVMEVLEDLDLTHRKDVQISRLSGGQQKRVSIGVELLTRPELFFLDEPTSGLDPSTETSLMQLMRRLADQGRTIVLITHATKNVMLADKVVFLARGGYLVWFGPPKEALEYFGRYCGGQPDQPMEFDQIYALLDDPSRGGPKDWAERFRQDPAYERYIQTPITEKEQALALKGKPSIFERIKNIEPPRPLSGIRQFMVLSSRNIRILVRDRSSLILMLLAPLLIGSLDLMIAPLMGRNIFDYYEGKAPNAGMTLFLLTLYVLLVGALSQMREITKEQAVYRRERLVNLKLMPYVTSKVWVALLLALYQAAVYTVLHYRAYHMPGGQLEFGLILATLFLGAFAGMMLGLVASALAPSASAAPMLTILLVLPNIVLSGVLVTLPQVVSAPSSAYWTYKGLMAVVGMGSDVAADDCWQFPTQLRNALAIDDKLYYECRCMGVKIFDPKSCNFPGMGQYYRPELDAPKPVEPPPLGEAPQQPPLPPAPEQPADQTDSVAVAMYLNALQAYQEEVQQIQDNFKVEVADYQARSEVYKADMTAYQKDLSAWYVGRTAAVGAAEGIINGTREKLGWAFVNQHDLAVYRQALATDWIALGVIIAALFGVTLLVMKRKDKSKN